MGVLVKMIDAILFIFLTVIAIGAPLIDSQTILPASLFPKSLVELKKWYTREYDDYLFAEKPHFFVGLLWLQLLFQWPLALINLYAILGSKSWFNTTSLIYGVSALTSTVIFIFIFLNNKWDCDEIYDLGCVLDFEFDSFSMV